MINDKSHLKDQMSPTLALFTLTHFDNLVKTRECKRLVQIPNHSYTSTP
jgi:hypothetical protein